MLLNSSADNIIHKQVAHDETEYRYTYFRSAGGRVVFKIMIKTKRFFLMKRTLSLSTNREVVKAFLDNYKRYCGVSLPSKWKYFYENFV